MVHKYIFYICAYAGIFGGIMCLISFVYAIFTHHLSDATVPLFTGSGMLLGMIWGTVIAHRQS